MGASSITCPNTVIFESSNRDARFGIMKIKDKQLSHQQPMASGIIFFLWLLLIFSTTHTIAAPPSIPHRIGGTCVINGIPVTQEQSQGYVFMAVTQAGEEINAASWDGYTLNQYGFYHIDIPLNKLEGQSERTVLLQAYKDGIPLRIVAPPGGLVSIGEEGLSTIIDISANIPGDLNQDFSVNMVDIVLGLQILSGYPTAGAASASIEDGKPIGWAEVLFALKVVSLNQ